MYEIHECLNPSSSVRFIALMKAAQIAGSAAAENRMLLEVAVDPGPLIYTTATDELAREWDEKRLEPLIELSGLSHKFKSNTGLSGKRTSGNRAKSKTYQGGGSIYATSYNKSSSIRTISFRTFIGDEIDSSKHTVGAEGDPVKNLMARMTAYEGREKAFLLSTPLLDRTSKIKKAFLLGDQRKYNVPCPHCSTMQKLEWRNIKYEVDKYNVIFEGSVYYQCKNKKCDDKIYNYHKTEMILCEELGGRAKWIPENPHARKNYRSYQISALYAPIGMVTWEKIAQEFVDAQENKEQLQNWVNLRLGEPYIIEGEGPQWREVLSLRDNYKIGSVDDNILCVTMAFDVQKGSVKDKKNPARIEGELVGHGENGKTWAIQYYRLEGSIDDAHSGAFKKLKELVLKKDFPVIPQVIAIDAAYKTEVVNEFCRGASAIFPIMGLKYIKNKMFSEKKLIEYGGIYSFDLNTDLYKQRLYNRLNLRKDVEGNAPFGYQFFPYDYPDNYFKMLVAEKRIEILEHGQVVNYKWIKKNAGAKNEALDIRVYNYAALDIFATNICKRFEMEKLDYKFFWKFCKKKIKLIKK